jgi:hypothetical protein
MEELGGECANIARTGRDLLAAGKLRYFPRREGYSGGFGRSDIGAMMADYWVDNYATTATAERNSFVPNGRNLRHALTHEIELAMKKEHVHVNGTEDPYNTANSKLCSGLY